MKYKKVGRYFLSLLNFIIPKYNQVIIEGSPSAESSAVEIAKQINSSYKLPIYFIDKGGEQSLGKLLPKDINIISRGSLWFFWYYFRSKYVFFTHGTFLNFYPQEQKIVNVWHGVFYKNIGRLLGQNGLDADITVATSEMTKKMFVEAFGVSKEKIIISSYPRNDTLIKSYKKKKDIKERVGLSDYKEILIWLPTYRKSVSGNIRSDGIEAGNPFNVVNFRIDAFNQLLVDNNTLCILKPHPMAPDYNQESLSNIWIIDDNWITDFGITLYHLLGCSDILISDLSSVMVDYLLIDNPIICYCSDLKEYKRTRGLYFNDIERWVPSK
ncbi:MAG: CDP-glycerol glycerophosphotransferase family protein [Balneolaceae bacterium]|nr:CDP-glycerol glycerophosphotransferase family protein [Balneolaceae bacterium]